MGEIKSVKQQGCMNHSRDGDTGLFVSGVECIITK